MDYYLVDCENVQSNYKKLFNDVKKDSRFIIFYSNKVNKISLSSNSKIQCDYKKVEVGTKNALDFQLSSYLGCLIKENKNNNYYIVSNDKGYDCLCSFWKDEKRVKVKRLSLTLTPGRVKNKCIKKDKPNLMVEEVSKFLPCEFDAIKITKIINESKDRQEICGRINKLYRNSEWTGIIYKNLKPLLKAKQI